ncbi:MAG: hypothetical protein HYR84_06650 [Planctomycetes bacterium]|nr:hypothetical protein [Planctomycetota bacterium]
MTLGSQSQDNKVAAYLLGVVNQFRLNIPPAGIARVTAYPEGQKQVQIARPKQQTPLLKDRKPHVAGVWKDNIMTLFVDGKKADSKTIGAEQLGDRPNSFFVIGDKLIGRLEEVRVSKVARHDTDFTPAPRFQADADTLALYHFDEGQGDVLKDHSSNGHDGKIVGAKWVKADEPLTKPAAATYGLDFGADPEAYVDLPPVLPFDQSFTVEMIVTPRGTTTTSMLFTARRGPSWYRLSQIGAAWRWAHHDKDVSLAESPNKLVQARMPTHNAGVSTGKELRLFVNGRLEKSTALIGTLPPMAVMKKLAGRDGPRASFDGTMSAVRISKGARNEDNFTPLKRFEADNDTLILYRFDEGQGDVLKDSSGNEHHGKIVGAKWVKADGTPIMAAEPAWVPRFSGTDLSTGTRVSDGVLDTADLIGKGGGRD